MVRVLFYGCLLFAAALAGFVGVAPWLQAALASRSMALRLFAEDAVVRRTALASALGLAVTAWVFFRGSSRNKKNDRAAPPGSIAGA